MQSSIELLFGIFMVRGVVNTNKILDHLNLWCTYCLHLYLGCQILPLYAQTLIDTQVELNCLHNNYSSILCDGEPLANLFFNLTRYMPSISCWEVCHCIRYVGMLGTRLVRNQIPQNPCAGWSSHTPKS